MKAIVTRYIPATTSTGGPDVSYEDTIEIEAWEYHQSPWYGDVAKCISERSDNTMRFMRWELDDNRQHQAEIVEGLSRGVTRGLLDDISSGKIPDEWDGFELRQLLADRFARQIASMSPKRKREYNNTVLVNNL